MTITAEELHSLLADLRAAHGVPGAAVAVLDGDTVVSAADGLAKRGAGIEATEDTRFQIGSITKTYTATLVMQLVDEGKVGLDDPILRHLPDLDVGGGDLSGITVRHLLTHTPGTSSPTSVAATTTSSASSPPWATCRCSARPGSASPTATSAS